MNSPLLFLRNLKLVLILKASTVPKERNRHLKKLGTVLGWGMERGITELFNRTTGQFLGPQWNHLTDKIRIHWFCNLGEGWHHALQPILEQLRRAGDPEVPGCLEYYQQVGYHLPHPDPWVWMTMALDCQVSRGQENDFLPARSPLTLQTLEQIEVTFSFLNTERKAYFLLQIIKWTLS